MDLLGISGIWGQSGSSACGTVHESRLRDRKGPLELDRDENKAQGAQLAGSVGSFTILMIFPASFSS